MYLAHNNIELQGILKDFRKESYSIGFVPTMGALHEGHVALIEQCVAENDICIASVFVNPTQFNDPKDLEKYPRQNDADFEILKKAGCHLMFAPQVSDIYPNGPVLLDVNLDGIENVIEGEYRPGHFMGVATVVNRFFELILPDKAYFGSKDYQQVVVIRKLEAQMPYNIDVVACETVRNENGLALSSRNKLLSASEKEEATIIYKMLQTLKTNLNNVNSIEELKDKGVAIMSKSFLELEYLAVIDGDTFEEVENINDHEIIIACTAAFCNGVRLIDNMQLKP